MKQLESQEAEDVEKTRKLVRELRRRIQNLYQQIIGWTGAPTEDQHAQIQFLSDAMAQLEPEVQAMSSGTGR